MTDPDLGTEYEEDPNEMWPVRCYTCNAILDSKRPLYQKYLGAHQVSLADLRKILKVNNVKPIRSMLEQILVDNQVTLQEARRQLHDETATPEELNRLYSVKDGLPPELALTLAGMIRYCCRMRAMNPIRLAPGSWHSQGPRVYIESAKQTAQTATLVNMAQPPAKGPARIMIVPPPNKAGTTAPPAIQNTSMIPTVRPPSGAPIVRVYHNV